MIINYLKTAWRHLKGNKKITLINLCGLSVGIAAFFVMSLFVWNELSYDRYNEKADRMVRVFFRANMPGREIKEANVMPPVARMLQDNFPEVEMATRLVQAGRPTIVYGEKNLRDAEVALVDSNFFNVFTLPMVTGNPATVLSQPGSVVITRRLARQYFGDADPLGKTLFIKDFGKPFTVTGVMEKIPNASHFHFDAFLPISERGSDQSSKSLMTSGYFTYLVLPKGYDYKKLEAKIKPLFDKELSPQLKQGMGMDIGEFHQSGNQIGLFLQRLTDIRLHSDFAGDLGSRGNMGTIRIFGAVALITLLLACVNFINLSTAGSLKRRSEVGIRKALGSQKGELIVQFLLESVLMAVISAIGGGLLVWLALPFFNSLYQGNLMEVLKIKPWFILAVPVFILLLGIVAGAYPAFFISSFSPLAILKGGLGRVKGAALRRGLIVFQFLVTLVLVVSSLVMQKQLAFMIHSDLGYKKDNVLIIEEPWNLGNNQEAFRQKLLANPAVANVTSSGFMPAGSSYSNNFTVYPGSESMKLLKTLRYDVDENFISTLGMKLMHGRNFSAEYGTDSLAVIINEATAKMLGWGANALDKTLTHRDNDGKLRTYHIIGIVKDFHFSTFRESISPLIMAFAKGQGSLIIRSATNDNQRLIKDLTTSWESLTPQAPMTYSFLSDRVARTYQAEYNESTILRLFTALAIFIACLGLYGLVNFIVEQRTREIGIRKVLGASVPVVVSLISKEFLFLVLISMLIATPLAYWLTREWLQGFVYHVEADASIFLIAGIIVLGIALVAISFQSIRAALANPVKSLRSE